MVMEKNITKIKSKNKIKQKDFIVVWLVTYKKATQNMRYEDFKRKFWN